VIGSYLSNYGKVILGLIVLIVAVKAYISFYRGKTTDIEGKK